MHRGSSLLSLYSVRTCQRHLTSVAPRPLGTSHKGISHQDFKLIEDFTGRLVERAARGPRHGWKATKKLRGDENEFRALVMDSRGQGFLSAREQEDDSGIADEENYFIAPGSFMELRKYENMTHAIALAETYKNRSAYVISLASSGRILILPKREVAFVLPAVASVELATRCGIEEVATSKKQVNARIEVLRRIRETEKLLEVACNTIAQKVRDIYPRVRSPDPDKWSEIRLAQAVKHVYPDPEPSPIATFAVHKQLMSRNREFIPEFSTFLKSQRYDVRPQSHVDTINAITAMSRRPGDVLKEFAKRVQLLVELNKKTAADSWNESPSYKHREPVFAPEDKVIIDFLVHSLDRRHVMQQDPYQLGLSVIVKALHIFDGELDASLVYQALVNTGVFPPWQDLFSHFATSDLLYGLQEPLPEVAEQNVFTRQAPSATSRPPASTAISPALTSLGPDEFHPYDLADSIRHDFGDMATYVIDDIGAEELDDGISFEPIPSEPNSAWVHVHIADPTALIHPNHNVARFACTRGETAYFLQQTWPMLPDGLGLSLNSTADRAPQRVLTFSIKVDSKGDIADYKVRPALVKNFVQLDYDSADFAMGLKPPRKYYPFGAEDIPQPSVAHLKQADVDNLHALKRVADRLVTARLRLPVYFQSTHKVLLSLSPKPLISPSFDITKRASFRGFPRITYGVSTIKDLDSGSRRLVSEMMKMACRVASVFCIDHDVPVLRRASGRPLAKSGADLEALLALRDDNGYVDFLDALSLEAASPPAEYTLKPKMHWGLGVPEGEGYVRVTSPLRRYDDMVSHWQIKHALLGSQGAPPFSADYLFENAKEVTVRQARRKQTINSHEKFWTMICVSRWMQERRMQEGHADPLADLMGVVLRLPTWEQTSRGYHCLVRLPTLGINGVVCGLTDITDFALGTRIPVKVDAVKFGLMPQLRLVRR